MCGQVPGKHPGYVYHWRQAGEIYVLRLMTLEWPGAAGVSTSTWFMQEAMDIPYSRKWLESLKDVPWYGNRHLIYDYEKHVLFWETNR